MGVNITTIVYIRVLIIQIGWTIILMVVEAQGKFKHLFLIIVNGKTSSKYRLTRIMSIDKNPFVQDEQQSTRRSQVGSIKNTKTSWWSGAKACKTKGAWVDSLFFL